MTVSDDQSTPEARAAIAAAAAVVPTWPNDPDDCEHSYNEVGQMHEDDKPVFVLLRCEHCGHEFTEETP